MSVRILFQYFVGGGGAMTNVLLLLRAISRTFPSDRLDIACGSGSELRSLASLENVEVLPFRWSGVKELDRLWLGAAAIQRLARERRADVVWSLNLGAYVRGAIPQVLSVHNPHQVYPWSVTRYHPAGRVSAAAMRWFFRRSLAASDAVIVQTGLMASCVRGWARRDLPIRVIPKAVETEEDVAPEPLPPSQLAQLESGLGRGAFTFLYVATAVPHKNHVTLVKAAERLRASAAPVRVAFTLKPEEIVALCGERAAPLLQSGHVVALGWTQKRHLRAAYEAADACAMPSVLESLSSAHLEAMQWRKPQIAADLPYARDLCNAAALYVAPEDPAAWADAMVRLSTDAALRASLVHEGGEQMKRFPATWGEVARQVREVLWETAERARQAPAAQRR